jgi:two-component system chemotaxis response regulator CheB
MDQNNTMSDPIKALIVDDALFMRKAIMEILETDSNLQIVGTAHDGLDGLNKIKELNPDVVTLDIDMPRMDGLEAIRHIMIESPAPVVVLSSLFSDGAVTFEALRLGVVDFVPKPSGAVSEDMDKSRRQIIDRVKIASSVNFKNIRRVRIQPEDYDQEEKTVYGNRSLEYIVALGTSLSGPNTVIRLMTRMSSSLPAAVVVVQEIAPQILPAFVEKFNEYAPWEIQVAQDGRVIEQGVCYICSNETALRIERNEDGQPCINLGDAQEKPLNLLFETAAEVFLDKTIGVMLTGIGDDGSEGFARIRKEGGVTIAQDMACCIYPNLTQHAIEMGTVTSIADEIQLPKAIEASIIEPLRGVDS